MNKKEAIMAMVQDGERVRIKTWRTDYYFEFVYGNFLDQDGDKQNINSFYCDEWELCRESKKKVKMWLWAYKDPEVAGIQQTTYFYATKGEASNAFHDPNITNIVPILGTEIEVEL